MWTDDTASGFILLITNVIFTPYCVTASTRCDEQQ
jgi:hypothetical protein